MLVGPYPVLRDQRLLNLVQQTGSWIEPLFDPDPAAAGLGMAASLRGLADLVLLVLEPLPGRHQDTARSWSPLPVVELHLADSSKRPIAKQSRTPRGSVPGHSPVVEVPSLEPHARREHSEFVLQLRQAIEAVLSAASRPPRHLDSVDALEPPQPRPAPGIPLFRPTWQRAILGSALSSTVVGEEIDLPGIVAEVARARSLERLPFLERHTLSRGVEVYVDAAASMMPFGDDLQRLLAALQTLVPGSRQRVSWFEGLPSDGLVADGLPIDWRVPPADCTVLIVGDLGLGPPAAGSAVVSAQAWRGFLEGLVARGHRVVVLTTSSDRVRSRIPRQGVLVLDWDRRTSVRDVWRAAVPAVGRTSGSSDLRRLARALSLAVEIEPALLRAMRLECFPELGVEVEARLWFAPWVAERDRSSIVFRGEDRKALLNELREDRTLLERAWAVVAAIHAEASPALRLEEETTYELLGGRIEAAAERLRRGVATLLQRDTLAEWAYALRDRLPLPEEGALPEEVHMLRFGGRVRLGIPPAPQDWESAATDERRYGSWLRPGQTQEVERITLGLRLVAGGVEIGTPGMELAHALAVPQSRPIALRLTAGERVVDLQLPAVPHAFVAFDDVEMATGVRVENALGEALELEFEVEEKSEHGRVEIRIEREVESGVESVEAPFLVRVVADLGGAREPGSAEVWHRTSAEDFDELFRVLRPGVDLQFPGGAGRAGSVVLSFRSLEGFEREAVQREVDDYGIGYVDASAVVGHEDFRRLEANWRALHRLVVSTDTSERLRIEVWGGPVPRDGESIDLASARHWFGSSDPFEEPDPGMLILGPELVLDEKQLVELGEVLVQAHRAGSMMVAALSPRAAGLEEWPDVDSGIDWKSLFLERLWGWQEFRRQPFADSLCLCVGDAPVRSAGDGDSSRSPASSGPPRAGVHWLIAERVVASVAVDGVPGRISGVDGGGRIEGLPLDSGDAAARVGVRPRSDQRSVDELRTHGVTAPWSDPSSPGIVLERPCVARFDERVEGSKPLAPVLFGQAWLRVLATMWRWKLGAFRSPEEFLEFANGWLAGYQLPDSEATTGDEWHRHPIASASLRIERGERGPVWILAIQPNVGGEVDWNRQGVLLEMPAPESEMA